MQAASAQAPATQAVAQSSMKTQPAPDASQPNTLSPSQRVSPSAQTATGGASRQAPAAQPCSQASQGSQPSPSSSQRSRPASSAHRTARGGQAAGRQPPSAQPREQAAWLTQRLPSGAQASTKSPVQRVAPGSQMPSPSAQTSSSVRPSQSLSRPSHTSAAGTQSSPVRATPGCGAWQAGERSTAAAAASQRLSGRRMPVSVADVARRYVPSGSSHRHVVSQELEVRAVASQATVVSVQVAATSRQ